MSELNIQRVAPEPSLLESPWLWIVIGGSVLAYHFRLGSPGWNDLLSSVLEQARITAGIACFLYSLDRKRSVWKTVLIALFATVVFGVPTRSFGFFPLLITLLTLALFLCGKRVTSAVFFGIGLMIVTVFLSLSPYRAQKVVELTLDWWDLAREGHQIHFGSMLTNVVQGRWLGSASMVLPPSAKEIDDSLIYSASWQLSRLCLQYGNVVVLAWLSYSACFFWWITRRIILVVGFKQRLLLFALAIGALILAIQPVMEISGLLPKWVGAHPIQGTLVGNLTLLLAIFIVRYRAPPADVTWPGAWGFLRYSLIGLTVLVAVKHVSIVIQ